MKGRIGCLMADCPVKRRVRGHPWMQTERGRLMLLLLCAVLFYALLIAAFNSISFGQDLMPPGVDAHPDVPFYQERTQALLEGQIPYLDIDTESPPLIMYLMIPAALMGNTLLAYALMFSGYAFITAGLVYSFIRPFGSDRAWLATAAFLFNPITWTTAVVFIQDEMVVTLFFVLPILLLLVNRGTWSVVASVLGTMTKVFSGVLIPLVLLKQKGKDRGKALVAAILTLVLVSLPFLMLGGEEFLFFFAYYLSQSGAEGQNEGISVWRFLHDAGLSIPGPILQLLFVAGTILVLYLIWKRDIDPVRSGFLLLMPFFLFFPKIFTCYFIIPFAVLCLLCWDDARPMALVTAAAFLAFFSQFFESFNGSESVLPTDGMWMMAPIMISLTVHAVWLYVSAGMLRSEGLKDRPPVPDTPPRSDP
ncbi:MAG: glycosyltransferase family 87 protein [Candidatus Methanomethylophilaceae archaeon]